MATAKLVATPSSAMTMAQMAIRPREASNSVSPLRHTNCLPYQTDCAEPIWNTKTEASDAEIRIALLSSGCRTGLHHFRGRRRAACRASFTPYLRTPYKKKKLKKIRLHVAGSCIHDQRESTSAGAALGAPARGPKVCTNSI